MGWAKRVAKVWRYCERCALDRQVPRGIEHCPVCRERFAPERTKEG